MWCGSLVFSVLAFYSDGPSLNPAVAESFSVECCLKISKINTGCWPENNNTIVEKLIHLREWKYYFQV